jgi:hypothetical protein
MLPFIANSTRLSGSLQSRWTLAENPLGQFGYDALMVLFDTRSKPTFMEVQKSKDTFAAFPGPIALVGTHTDTDPQKVSYDEGLEFANTDTFICRFKIPRKFGICVTLCFVNSSDGQSPRSPPNPEIFGHGRGE